MIAIAIILENTDRDRDFYEKKDKSITITERLADVFIGIP